MKFLKSFLVLLTVAGIVSACQQEVQYLGVPRLALSGKTMEFEIPGGAQGLELTATRDWSASSQEDWVVVTPDKGTASPDPQKFTVTVLENKGVGRKAEVVFTIGMTKKTLVVSQEGPLGSAEDLIVYSNNFDKTEAVKGDQWKTYLDSFDGWRNETGTGLAGITYGFESITARTNSGNGSAGTYSVYEGSGMNYLWFGSGSPYFAVKNIALPDGKTDFTLSFGAERYLYGVDSNVFDFNEFKVYISADAQKWVKLSCDFAGGSMPDGKWDLASSTFTVPEGTSALSVYLASSLASAYAIDDLSLVISSEAGTPVDFSKGEEIKVEDSTIGGGNQGGSTDIPVSAGKKTVQEFIAAADDSNYYELTGTVSGFNKTYCSFDLTDATGKIYVYSVLASSKTEWADKISNGGTVTIYGKYYWYDKNSQHEVKDAYIVSFTGGTGGSGDEGGSVGGDTGGEKGEYDPDGLTWTLGDNAYDKSSSASQTAVVNGVQVNDLLKLGTSSKLGNSMLHVPAGTKKIGFYGISWTNKGKAALKFTSGSSELASVEVNENAGATGNPPYTITVTDSDWYEIEVSAVADMDIKVETTNTASPRAILIGLKAIPE